MADQETVEVETKEVKEDLKQEQRSEGELPDNRQWAALVRKEATLTKRAGELRQFEGSLKEREEKIASLEAKVLDAQKAVATSANRADDGKPADDKVAALAKRLDEWESNLKKREAEITAETTQARIIEMERQYLHGTLVPAAKANPDKYELVLSQDAADLALNVIKEHYNATGGNEDPLTPEEALGMVEEYLREQADKIANTGYIKSKFKPADEAEAEQKKPEKPKPRNPRTIGNSPSQAPDEKKSVASSSDERWNALVTKHFGDIKPAPVKLPKKAK